MLNSAWYKLTTCYDITFVLALLISFTVAIRGQCEVRVCIKNEVKLIKMNIKAV